MQKRLVLTLTLTLLLLLPAARAQAEEMTLEKQADIRQMIELSGAQTMGKQLAATMTQQYTAVLRRTRPDIPPRVLAVVERVTTAVIAEKVDAPGGLIDRIVPLYANTFSHQEIREILAFYRSPAGRKITASMPGLMRDGQKIGMELAKEMGPELKRRLVEALSKEAVVLDRLPD